MWWGTYQGTCRAAWHSLQAGLPCTQTLNMPPRTCSRAHLGPLRHLRPVEQLPGQALAVKVPVLLQHGRRDALQPREQVRVPHVLLRDCQRSVRMVLQVCNDQVRVVPAAAASALLRLAAGYWVRQLDRRLHRLQVIESH